MAVPWLTVLKLVPWGDVISNAPKVAEGAKKLWGTMAKKSEVDAPPAMVTIDPHQDAARAITLLQQQLQAQQQTIDGLTQQVRDTASVVQQLADQNLELIARMERQRVQLRWLAVLAVIALAGVVTLVIRTAS